MIGCDLCRDYKPHTHPERLNKIPSAPTILVCGTGDIAFCKNKYVRQIINTIDAHKPRKPKLYYLQSKNPACFRPYLPWLDEKYILVTTLETNRDTGYAEISQAPPPSIRFADFYALNYPRKVVTIEPVLDFDLDTFTNWILSLMDQGTLQYVWFGYDSKRCSLPEPSTEKAQRLVDILKGHGVEVRGKTLRGIRV